jgi:hypothetical protein
MNGATALPFARSSNPPKTASMKMMGISQYFRRIRMNIHSSVRNDTVKPCICQTQASAKLARVKVGGSPSRLGLRKPFLSSVPRPLFHHRTRTVAWAVGARIRKDGSWNSPRS